MEFIQDLLTAAIQFTALAGFGGIAAHAMWKHHTNWMAEYCPPVKLYTPDTQVEVEAIAPVEQEETAGAENTQPEIEDIWEAPITSSSARYWVRQQPQSIKPVLMLVAAKEEVKPVVPTRKTVTKKTQQPLDINLNSLDSAALRKLCSKHGIQWRDARGKGKHLTKAAMVFQLEQKAVA